MSLREQLLAAGLVSKKQAQQAEQQERQSHHKQHKHTKGKPPVQSEAQKRAAEEAAAKLARDQELNRKRQEEAERRAKMAQIKQLIEENRLPKLETDEYFNFVDRGKVRRLAVDTERRERLIAGSLKIVRCEGKYDVVLPDIAERIRERDARAVVNLDAPQTDTPAEDDPYKDFVVPDDLRW